MILQFVVTQYFTDPGCQIGGIDDGKTGFLAR